MLKAVAVEARKVAKVKTEERGSEMMFDMMTVGRVMIVAVIVGEKKFLSAAVMSCLVNYVVKVVSMSFWLFVVLTHRVNVG